MRRRKAKKIAVLPDPKFNDVVVTKFVNNIMLQGKKSVAFRLVFQSKEKTLTDAAVEEYMSILQERIASGTTCVVR